MQHLNFIKQENKQIREKIEQIKEKKGINKLMDEVLQRLEDTEEEENNKKQAAEGIRTKNKEELTVQNREAKIWKENL